MSDKFTIAYKKLGQTPLECLNEVKIAHPEWTNLPMTYAGRLDPMAEGLMIVLVGEECKNKDQYLGLSKTYEFQVLVGFSTDTYDLLGRASVKGSFLQVLGSPLQSPMDEKAQPDHSENLPFTEVLKTFVGRFTQKYPSFSSKTVNGTQLFQLSKDDELPDELPEHEVTISKLEYTGTEIFDKDELQKEIIRRIDLVKGDFRQKEIIEKWNQAFEQSNRSEYTIFSCICECSSGTYIRQLVADIGAKLGVPLVTYSIKRTRVGDLSFSDIKDK